MSQENVEIVRSGPGGVEWRQHRGDARSRLTSGLRVVHSLALFRTCGRYIEATRGWAGLLGLRYAIRSSRLANRVERFARHR